jgi:hypothetical protein
MDESSEISINALFSSVGHFQWKGIFVMNNNQ